MIPGWVTIQDEYGTPVSINVDHVLYVKGHQRGRCKIVLDDDSSMECNESREVMAKKMQLAKQQAALQIAGEAIDELTKNLGRELEIGGR